MRIKYRILKCGGKYTPQSKRWFFWVSFRHMEYCPGVGASFEVTVFESLNAAEVCIRNHFAQKMHPHPATMVVWEDELVQ